ncbi:MAG: molybdenum cofactor biosynthesis protein MoaE [Chloroflexi bacterium]|nr:molybdenum cofactor biosynthesis protein MoaE [Chloroflexota bacterium]
MQVTIRLFAGLKDVVGSDLIAEQFDRADVSVADLRTRLEQSQPKLKPYLSGVAIAVNEDYILEDNHLLVDGDTVALVPPISGGANETPLFLVTREPLRPQALRDAVITPEAGAAVVFEGVVRNHHEGRAVERLEYEAYAEMAERQLRAVAGEVLADFAERELYAIAAHHRIGPLAVGETSLLVVATAAHRRDAFEAALRAVDRIKETVPVWKKEFGPDGSHWQEGVVPKPVRPSTAEPPR